MRRRAGTSSTAPAELVAFELDDWQTGGANAFERYDTALHRWLDARNAWAAAHHFDGDPDWWAAAHDAILAMPDAPFDAADL